MIPLKIQLKNFLSYPNELQTIDFKDYPLVCLSGKNGHGKSALLDAMTWVLWGQARKISGTIKADLGLIRLGQTQMLVSFEFEFNGNLYKVRREFTKTYGKPLVALDFELFDSQKEKFIPLTDKTIKLTEKKIENLLGLDFDTFSNTAFLRQGQSNEFSKKSPKERKQILANILGLSRYDALQKIASDKAKNFDSNKKILNSVLQKNTEEIKREGSVDDEKKQTQTSLEKINTDLGNKQKDLLNLEKEKHIKEEKKKEYLFLLKDVETLKSGYLTKLKDFKELVCFWKTAYYKSLSISSFDDLERIKNNLNIKDKEFLVIQQKSLNLQESILQKKTLYQKEESEFKGRLEQEIYKLRLNLEKESFEQRQVETVIKQKEKDIYEYEKKLNLSDKELLNFQDKLKNKQKFIDEFEKIKSQFEKRRSFYQLLVQKGNWVKTQISDVKQKVESLQCNQSPSCPLCQQVLTITRKKFLAGKFELEDKFHSHKMNRVSSLLKKLKPILFEQHEQVKKLQNRDDEYKNLYLKHVELGNLINQIKLDLKNGEKSITELSLKIKECALKSKVIKNSLGEKEKELKDGLESNKRLKKQQREIELLEKELKSLRYDKAAHLRVQKEFIKIEKKLQDIQSLKDDLLKQGQRKIQISFLSSQLKEIKKTIQDKEKKIKEVKIDKNLMLELENKIDKFKKLINTTLKDKEILWQKLGRLQNESERIKKLKSENKKKQKEIENLSEEQQYYQFLTRTFGRDGIQALLIEQAIPEIEEEANKILSRLTDNQSQIFFESLRDLKKGGVKETLDIQIADSVGMRPYEMFSGGEAFRVDFALRIAISKLLARRAGTALQTLIIDEGFGSQDEEGLSRLMDSIYAIQDDFAKIIVVSHLAAFKDNFPVHFIVNKTSAGSFITVEERG